MGPLHDVAEVFKRACKADPETSEAIAAVGVLNNVIRNSDATTVQGLHDALNNAISKMSNAGCGYLCVKSACELFQRFITLTVSEAPDDFDRCKQVLQERAKLFLSKVRACKQQIADNLVSLLAEGSHVLVHSYSRVVLAALSVYTKGSRNNRLHCYVTPCSPHDSGRKMMKELIKLRISCSVVPDLAIAYLMPQVNFVLMGAQAVVESGGILNDLGSSTVAMIASAFGKPVYVLAESFKFIRAFPLDQQHISHELQTGHPFSPSCFPFHSLNINDYVEESSDNEDFPETRSPWIEVSRYRSQVIDRTVPNVDYTNPYYISFLITDLGILTPSVVSDELIKLYL